MLNNLVKLILLEKSEIVTKWVKQIKSLGGSYVQVNVVEMSDLCAEFLDAFSDILGEGNFLKLRMFVEKVSQLRSSQGFRLSEVQHAYYSLYGIIRPMIVEQESKSGNAEAMLDKVNSILIDVIFEFSESYHKKLNERIDNYIDDVESANLKLRETSIRDELTGCYNRKYFQNCLESEVSRSKRYNRPIAVIMLDMDNLKELNEDFGVAFGDSALRKVGDIIKKSVRNSDTVFRYGGESFSVILPETKKDKAFILAERIRKEIEETPFTIQNRTVKVSVSGGVNGFDDDSVDKYNLLADADKALCQAKDKGKNQVILFDM
ncbi:GGDEF domain-containing protein [Thermoproteota archaeon]